MIHINKNQRPIVYHYKLFYDDGRVINQYNENYRGMKFTDIDENGLIKFGLYPIPQDLAENLSKNGTEARSIPFLPEYEIELDENKRLIWYKQCYISQEEYRICENCKKEFQASSKLRLESKYPSPICPHCGAHDDFYCKKCDKSYIFEDTSNGLCPKCNGYMQRRKTTSKQYSRERRWNEYCIGYQTTINNKNFKVLLTIDETGNCKIT